MLMSWHDLAPTVCHWPQEQLKDQVAKLLEERGKTRSVLEAKVAENRKLDQTLKLRDLLEERAKDNAMQPSAPESNTMADRSATPDCNTRVSTSPSSSPARKEPALFHAFETSPAAAFSFQSLAQSPAQSLARWPRAQQRAAKSVIEVLDRVGTKDLAQPFAHHVTPSRSSVPQLERGPRASWTPTVRQPASFTFN